MSQKRYYQAPAILQEVAYSPQECLLAGSIVKDATVTSVGQQVDTYDFEGSTFNHDWEN